MDTVAGIKKWAGRRIVRRALRRRDLSSSVTIPGPLAIPLRRDGLDPVPEIARARASAPITELGSFFGTTVWLVTGYDEVRTVLADTSSFSNDIRGLVGRKGATGTAAIGGLGFTDPPEHTRLRRLLTPEFTMRRLRRLEPRVEAIVDEQLDVVASSGRVVDLIPTFAFPVPFRVICELLGLSLDDRAEFRALGHARFDASAGAAGLLGAMSESRSFLIDAAVRQRSRPGDGLIGALIREHGDEIDDVELGGLADGVFTGGYETSASMLGLGTLTLLQPLRRRRAGEDGAPRRLPCHRCAAPVDDTRGRPVGARVHEGLLRLRRGVPSGAALRPDADRGMAYRGGSLCAGASRPRRLSRPLARSARRCMSAPRAVTDGLTQSRT